MTDKSLKSKAIDIKGKKYVLVPDRVLFFNDNYPDGAIQTNYKLANDTFYFTAKVIPKVDTPERYFTGHSQAVIGEGIVNKTAAMENAETSAVGRALAMMGIGVIDSIASVDEINKAQGSNGTHNMASDSQIKTIESILERMGVEDLDWFVKEFGGEPKQLTSKAASAVIGKLIKASKEKSETDKPDYEAGEGLDDVAEVSDEPITLDNIPF